MITIALRINSVVDPTAVEVFVHLRDDAPVFGVHCEHLVEEGEELGREFLPRTRRLAACSTLPLHKLVVVWVTECGLFPGKAASQHTEEEDAYRPNVARRVYKESSFIGSVADLRWSVRNTATYSWNMCINF